MGKNRIVNADWYDYPQYYDIAFHANTQREADFIEAACRKYCSFEVRRLLEPACGSGRLVGEFAHRRYRVTGFDLSEPALTYLRRQLRSRRLKAETFRGEMSNFQLRQFVDAAYCLINTFRHLLTEQAACAHLKCIATSLRPGGIYTVAIDLLSKGDRRESERWTRKRGKTYVTVTQRVLRRDVRRRLEHRQVCLIARCGSRKLYLQHEFQLRTYTHRQFRRALALVPSLELCGVYNFCRDIDDPVDLDDQISYGVFVLRRRGDIVGPSRERIRITPRG